ncbi:putative oxidoreductase (short-chain dehydrogenase family) [Natrialba magadii ATCC 43099]|uniref:Oxidoreductase (Short-chain dehydrogenase family) n=1 Tax=Natrialba magadii (strain ATCC 43099 / DSM 3394 / CCM 3739 / CIP 104546 / IAM 13178 / JCM 8861 / NBRC 102185 / NCIMB 2190 / MS3) TaxID=547559 RepID=D3SR70_NATMM|nr:glucose 1-dehydrogenase [Natrialba magadii]ADD06626.1 putative oxidoreductase (short-chain dehydrogenase family) [Natrialba magadii ATCC 43099]ELY31913.1 short-chain dehydrogenase/reductase SDR [Natrialba magadii ATCC 43099]
MTLVDDRVAVITGAGSGIGRTTATTFADHGASVVVADVDAEGGRATVETITDDGGEATFVETDVSDLDDAQVMVDTAVDEYGGLDVLFNNAAIEGPVARLDDYENDAFEQVIDVNLKGVWYGMKYGIKAMLEDGGGSIISASSIGGEVAVPQYSGYGAAKAAVGQLTRYAAIEYAEEGIRANAVAPGIVRTEMIERTIEEHPEMEEQFEETEPMPGLAEPEEIANAVLFLGSDLSSRVTGVTLPVEGGYLSQ